MGLLTMRDLAGFGDAGPPPGKETPLTQGDYMEYLRRSAQGPTRTSGVRVEGEEEDEVLLPDPSLVVPSGTPKWDYSRGSYYATSPEAVAKRAEEIRLRAAPAGSGDTPSVIASPFKAAGGLLSQLLTWITTAPTTAGEAVFVQPGSRAGRIVSRIPDEAAALVTGRQTPTGRGTPSRSGKARDADDPLGPYEPTELGPMGPWRAASPRYTLRRAIGTTTQPPGQTPSARDTLE